MRRGRGDPVALWGILATLSLAVAIAALTLSLAVSGAAVIFCLVVLGVFALLTFALVYLALAAHFGWRPFREPPMEPLVALTGPDVESDPPIVEPSLEGLTRRLEQLRDRSDHIVPPSDRVPED